eukprot:15364486-Ditylum_brightwellii.AAC.1
MMSSTMVDDDVIIILTHVVGFVYYQNKVEGGENIVLMREPLCQYDKLAILVTSMEGDTIGHVARTHSITLVPILDFMLRNESGITSTYIMGKSKWTHA